jgi:hypothetical protein
MATEPEILPALTPRKQFLYAAEAHLIFESPYWIIFWSFGLKAVIMSLQQMTMNDSAA